MELVKGYYVRIEGETMEEVLRNHDHEPFKSLNYAKAQAERLSKVPEKDGRTRRCWVVNEEGEEVKGTT